MKCHWTLESKAAYLISTANIKCFCGVLFYRIQKLKISFVFKLLMFVGPTIFWRGPIPVCVAAWNEKLSFKWSGSSTKATLGMHQRHLEEKLTFVTSKEYNICLIRSRNKFNTHHTFYLQALSWSKGEQFSCRLDPGAPEKENYYYFHYHHHHYQLWPLWIATSSVDYQVMVWLLISEYIWRTSEMQLNLINVDL